MTFRPFRQLAVAVVAITVVSCSSDDNATTPANSDPTASSATEPTSSQPIESDPSATVQAAPDSVAPTAGQLKACDVLRPATFIAVVPEMEPFSYNEELNAQDGLFGENFCVYADDTAEPWILYLSAATESTPTELIDAKIAIAPGWETTALAGGVGLVNPNTEKTEALAVEGSGWVVLLVSPGQDSTMSNDSWELSGDYLKSQLDQLN